MKFLAGVITGAILTAGVVSGTAFKDEPEKSISQPIGNDAEVDQSDSSADAAGVDPSSDTEVATFTDAPLAGDSSKTLADIRPDNSADYTIESGRGPDGYHVDHADFDHEEIALKVYKYRSEKAFKDAIAATGEDPSDTEGVSYSSTGSNECVIIVRDPAFRYDPVTVGHEITHCIYGRFHANRYPD